jgi:hypothetical protein
MLEPGQNLGGYTLCFIKNKKNRKKSFVGQLTFTEKVMLV